MKILKISMINFFFHPCFHVSPFVKLKLLAPYKISLWIIGIQAPQIRARQRLSGRWKVDLYLKVQWSNLALSPGERHAQRLWGVFIQKNNWLNQKPRACLHPWDFSEARNLHLLQLWLLNQSQSSLRTRTINWVKNFTFQNKFPANWHHDLALMAVSEFCGWKSCPYMHVSNYCKYLCAPLLNGGVLYRKRGRGEGGEEELEPCKWRTIWIVAVFG